MTKSILVTKFSGTTAIIDAELFNNGGSSLRDAIDRIERNTFDNLSTKSGYLNFV